MTGERGRRRGQRWLLSVMGVVLMATGLLAVVWIVGRNYTENTVAEVLAWIAALASAVGVVALSLLSIRYSGQDRLNSTPAGAFRGTITNAVSGTNNGVLGQIRDVAGNVYMGAPPASSAPVGLAGRALHLVDGRLPTVSQVDLIVLRVKPAIESSTNRDTDFPPYVTRDVDATLRSAISTMDMVLLHGRTASGKSRTALEALRAVRPNTPLVLPRDGHALRELADAGLVTGPAVVWLDDLERFLGPHGVELGLLQFLCHERSGIVVVATMRDELLAHYDHATTASRADLPTAVDRASVDLLAHLSGPRRIRIEQELTRAEHGRAREQAHTDSRVARALAANEGFAEYLAAGVALLRRWTTGDGPMFHAGQALISAAVDCRRTGIHDPVPADLLAVLQQHYLPPGWRHRTDLPLLPDALKWACEPVLGAKSCLQPRDRSTYLAADYLLDQVHQGDTPLRHTRVVDGTWHAVLAIATPAQQFTIGVAAYGADRGDIAEIAFSCAADQGDVDAMIILGLMLDERGDVERAKHWRHTAAACGDTTAMVNIEFLFKKRYEVGQLEREGEERPN